MKATRVNLGDCQEFNSFEEITEFIREGMDNVVSVHFHCTETVDGVTMVTHVDEEGYVTGGDMSSHHHVTPDFFEEVHADVF